MSVSVPAPALALRRFARTSARLWDVPEGVEAAAPAGTGAPYVADDWVCGARGPRPVEEHAADWAVRSSATHPTPLSGADFWSIVEHAD
ncbi:hypothetical protein ACH4OX_16325 [Streptomyces roseolus]|uniref:hypothetical protein n=1 Tax=Streptomyces roseolus TaxID=67358 RepID=UPI0037BD5E9B